MEKILAQTETSLERLNRILKQTIKETIPYAKQKIGYELAWAAEKLIERRDVSLQDIQILTSLVLDIAFSNKAWSSVAVGIKRLGEMVSKYGYACAGCHAPGAYEDKYCPHCHMA